MRPELLNSLRGYSKEDFFKDLTAGIIVGIIAIPLAIAFAIASGVSPEKGLITAVIGGFLVSAFGGSRVQIGGPTGAFIVIVYGIIEKYDIAGLTIATFMAGIILMLMGFSGLGSIIKFIPYPVIVGFTSGIALIIFSTQIKDIFGLAIADVPSDFLEKWQCYFENMDTTNFQALALSMIAMAIILYTPRISVKLPGSLLAIIITTILVHYLGFQVDTIGSRFGTISAEIPVPRLPSFDFATVKNLLNPAITIALLAAIESLLSAMVADGMTGGRHSSNMELVAQGAANVVVPFFGGIPVTGAIARTAANIKNGGRTPVSGIIHALTLFMVLLFFGKYAAMIPMATLGAILVVVAYNMSEWQTFLSLLKSPKSDVSVLVTVFLLTVLFDLTIAIQVGIMLAVLLFMRRMAEVSNIEVITREMRDGVYNASDDPMAIDKKEVPEGIDVFEINGPFFFGVADKFREAVGNIIKKPKVRIIRLRSVPAIDATGLNMLRQFMAESNRLGIKLVLSGVSAQPLFAMGKDGLLEKIGRENVHQNIDDALERGCELLKESE